MIGEDVRPKVTATDNPKIWRVEIPVPLSPKTRAEIVCYLGVTDLGLRVYYSHHMIYTRPVELGTWDFPQASKMSINPQLVAQIESNMSAVLWEIARGDHALEVLPLPTEMARVDAALGVQVDVNVNKLEV